ncbi:hypothetical protein [Flavobacterium anhuiense]|uniref:hypothetical protein n=1 Tax=Flavobacterium anhuiense TaxID=459526 RepID=UPI000E6CBCD1|nr:hypothetical protein [Flavobacterium anhuiense]
MEYLINIGYAILCALGLVVFLVIMWFAIGIFLAMKDIFLRRKKSERNFIAHDEIIEKVINNN